MEDIFNSVKRNTEDIESIKKEYESIKEEINKLFDTRVLPLPEDYIA